jgi:hypothetical protein
MFANCSEFAHEVYGRTSRALELRSVPALPGQLYVSARASVLSQQPDTRSSAPNKPPEALGLADVAPS